MLQIRVVKARKHLREFIALPDRVYADDTNHVPTDRLAELRRFDKRREPFFEHGDADLYAVWRNGVMVARISAHVDRTHNAVTGERTAFFGHFECENDPEAARTLFDVATTWARDRGYDRIVGPMSWSIHGRVGALVHGFDAPPYVGMGHGRTYYPDLIEDYGFSRDRDLLSWLHDCRRELPAEAQQRADRIEMHPGLQVRALESRDLGRDLRAVVGLLDRDRAAKKGGVPLTPREVDRLIRHLRAIVEPRISFIADVDGLPVAASLSLLNVNTLRSRLLDHEPFGVPAKVFWERRVRRRLTSVRVITAAPPSGQLASSAADLRTLLHVKTHRIGQALGLHEAELGWTAEDDAAANDSVGAIGALAYKRYRVYGKDLH